MKKITVVSPCYNEEDNVETCYETVKAIFERDLPGYEREHIFVDNCSSDRTVEILRESRGMRLLQSRACGGYQADPRDFFAWARAVAQYNPAAGWVAGVVGIHPFEMGLVDEKLQAEVYGDQGVLIQNHDDSPSTNVPPPPGAIALKQFTHGESGWRDLGQSIPPSHADRIAGVPRAFIDAVRSGAAPPVTAWDGRVAVEMVLGAYQSAAEGRRVRFPLTKD